jgi:uncharacterized protein
MSQSTQKRGDLKRNSYNCKITLCICVANIKKISDMPELSNNEFLEQYGKWALLAGAAEGIGAAFSEVLAKKGMNLAMVDINPDKLAELSSRLEGKYGIKTRQLVNDISNLDAAGMCMDIIKDIECKLLIYVPAYSPVKRFLDNSPEELDKYINLNSRTPLHLVHLFTAQLKNLGGGGILLMSSLAGLIGPPYSAPYAATKAFNIVLAESLSSEFRQNGIDITVCCAGQTSTPTYWSSKPSLTGNWPGVMKPLLVAEYALKKIGRKTICIPGWENRFSYFILTRLLSRRLSAAIVGKAMDKMYS